MTRAGRSHPRAPEGGPLDGAARPVGGASSLQHDAVLAAVASTAEHLLLAADWREAADEVLARLGTAAGVSRAYVIENRIDADGRLVGTMRHEWCAPGVSSQFGNPVLEAVPWDGGFARWAAAHARGEPVFGLVADMPEAERTEIEAQDIVSIAEHPVFVGDEWWGAIGFDDCERERRWASEPRRPAGGGDRARGRRRPASRRARAPGGRAPAVQVVEHIPAVTYTDVVVAPDKVRMEFVSPQMRTILGVRTRAVHRGSKLLVRADRPRGPGPARGLGGAGIERCLPLRRGVPDASGRRLGPLDPRHVDPGVPGRRPLDHFLGFMIDVTERMRAQSTCGRPRSGTGCWWNGPRDHLHRVDRRALRRDVGDLLPQPADRDRPRLPPQRLGGAGFWMQVTHPDDRDEVMAESTRASATGEPYRQEYRMIARDGRVVWIHDESVIVHDADGRPSTGRA